jgi:hypothetical protein
VSGASIWPLSQHPEGHAAYGIGFRVGHVTPSGLLQSNLRLLWR